MNLREWRKSKGYSLREVALLMDRKSHQAVHNIETRGATFKRVQGELKLLSNGEITDFRELKG